MVISQIFQYLTRKQVNNSQTILPNKSVADLFLEQKNISRVAVYMYNGMEFANRPPYLQYRDTVAKYMNDWIWKQTLPKDSKNADYGEYVQCRFNEQFIRDHRFLIKKADVMYTSGLRLPNMLDGAREINSANKPDLFYTVLPDGVHDKKFRITKRDANDNIIGYEKKGRDMMPADYQNWDVWREQTTYADFDFEKYRSFRDKYGYANAYIPRNVDRDPESFGLTHRNPLEASLTNQVYAYDNDEYMRAKGLK